MEQKHTPEPWRVSGNGTMRFIDASVCKGMSQKVATCMRVEYGDMEANARRIVACVNACAGLDTYLLENSGDIASAAIAQAQYIQKIEKQRDMLLEALEFLLNDAESVQDICLREIGIGIVNINALQDAKKAIASAKEQK